MKTYPFHIFAFFIGITTIISCQEIKNNSPIDAIANEEIGQNLEQDNLLVQFVHPGILNSTSNLDFIASDTDNNRPWTYSQVEHLIDNIIPFPSSFPSIVYRNNIQYGESPPTEKQMLNDATLAYAYALKWAKTGNATDANKAKDILNGWASNFSTLKVCENTDNPSTTGCPEERSQCASNPNVCIYPQDSLQTKLYAAWVAPTFAMAAEIIRHYEVNGNGAGWSSGNISNFEDFLVFLNNEYFDDLVSGVINNPNSGWASNNWGASAAWAQMATGVFTNDTNMFNKGKQAITKNNGLIDNIIHPSSGEVNECQRNNYTDCSHPQYSLMAIAYAAETARIQGDWSLYGAHSKRLKKGWEWISDAFTGTVSCQTNSFSCSSPGDKVMPGVEVAYNFYHSDDIKTLRNLQEPYADVTRIFSGFTTYTHYNTAPFWNIRSEQVGPYTIKVEWETDVDDDTDIEFYKTGEDPWSKRVTMWQPAFPAQDGEYDINLIHNGVINHGTWHFRIAHGDYRSAPTTTELE